jgi:hypothetical protein
MLSKQGIHWVRRICLSFGISSGAPQRATALGWHAQRSVRHYADSQQAHSRLCRPCTGGRLLVGRRTAFCCTIPVDASMITVSKGNLAIDRSTAMTETSGYKRQLRHHSNSHGNRAAEVTTACGPDTPAARKASHRQLDGDHCLHRTLNTYACASCSVLSICTAACDVGISLLQLTSADNRLALEAARGKRLTPRPLSHRVNSSRLY